MKFSEFNKTLSKKLQVESWGEPDRYEQDMREYEAREMESDRVDAIMDEFEDTVSKEFTPKLDEIRNAVINYANKWYGSKECPHLEVKFVQEGNQICPAFYVDGVRTDDYYDYAFFPVNDKLPHEVRKYADGFDVEEKVEFNIDDAYEFVFELFDDAFKDEYKDMDSLIHFWIENDDAGKAYAEKYLN